METPHSKNETLVHVVLLRIGAQQMHIGGDLLDRAVSVRFDLLLNAHKVHRSLDALIVLGQLAWCWQLDERLRQYTIVTERELLLVCSL